MAIFIAFPYFSMCAARSAAASSSGLDGLIGRPPPSSKPPQIGDLRHQAQPPVKMGGAEFMLGRGVDGEIVRRIVEHDLEAPQRARKQGAELGERRLVEVDEGGLMVERHDPGLAGMLGGKRHQRDEVLGLLDHAGAVAGLDLQFFASGANAVLGVMALAPGAERRETRRHRVERDRLGVRMQERGAGAGAVVAEQHHRLHARLGEQYPRPVAIGAYDRPPLLG